MNTLLRSAALLIVAFVAAGLALPARAEITTIDEARMVAENQVRLVIAERGSWGGHADAEVVSIEPFRRDEQLIGYVCHIAPVGYILVSPLRELAPIRAGQRVTFTVVSYPGESFEGRVIEVSPAVDAQTRSAKVRSQVNNRGGKLKAGMFAQGEIQTGIQQQAIVIPASAVYRDDRSS